MTALTGAQSNSERTDEWAEYSATKGDPSCTGTRVKGLDPRDYPHVGPQLRMC